MENSATFVWRTVFAVVNWKLSSVVINSFQPLLFSCLGVVAAKSTRWSVPARVIYSLMIFISVVSLIFYSGILSLEGTKPAFMFLVVPFMSWVIMVIALVISRRISR